MPRKVTAFEAQGQPISWSRALTCGSISSMLMMAFIDTFYLMGITPFSFELYLGSLLRGTQYGIHNWTIGFLASVVLGGLFGIFYAYCFEYVFIRSSTRLGIWVGTWHAIAAAFLFFPFFGSIHEFIGTGLFPQFGIMGYKLGAPTPILLVTAHLLFGACMGLFYGPVKEERIRSRYFEPGDVALKPSEGGISSEEDPEDRIAV